MTKTRIVALLSVLALLASLPLSVALAQGTPPFRVVGTAEIDGAMAEEGTMVVAMIDGEKAGEGMVDAMGRFSVDVEGEEGAMVMFSFMMGEGDAMMEYSASSMMDVMVGMAGELTRADLMAYSSDAARPTPTKTAAQEMEAMRGPRGATGPRGEQGEPGPQGEQGNAGPPGPRGPAGSDGSDGAAGSAGPAGSDGSDGRDGSDGDTGPAGPKGDPGAAGPAGPAGATGPAGAQGEAGGGGALAIVALIIAIVGVVAAGGAFIAGRQSS